MDLLNRIIVSRPWDSTGLGLLSPLGRSFSFRLTRTVPNVGVAGIAVATALRLAGVVRGWMN